MTITHSHTTQTLNVDGVIIPDRRPEHQGFQRVWKPEPEPAKMLPIARKPPQTYDEACEMQGRVFTEEGIFRSNFFLIRDGLDENRYSEQRQKGVGRAMKANRQRWRKLKKLYHRDLARLSEQITRLYERDERAKRERAAVKAAAVEARNRKSREEAQAKEAARAKAKGFTDPSKMSTDDWTNYALSEWNYKNANRLAFDVATRVHGQEASTMDTVRDIEAMSWSGMVDYLKSLGLRHTTIERIQRLNRGGIL